MAFSLQPGESAAAGLKRIVTEEIDAALAGIATSTEAARDGAIHEARKSVKKIRAVLRLIRDRAPRVYVREVRRLKVISRRLSGLRDAAAMIESFDILMNGTRQLRAVRNGLVNRRNRKVGHREAEEVLAATVADFQKMKRRVEGWKLHVEVPSGLEPAAAKSRRKARRAWKLARKHPDTAIWHEFRKKVKDQVYHERLLQAAAVNLSAHEKKQLEELEEALGEDHNLVVLNDLLSSAPAKFGGEKHVAAALDLLGQKQRKLRDLSLSIGSKLYGAKNGAH